MKFNENGKKTMIVAWSNGDSSDHEMQRMMLLKNASWQVEKIKKANMNS